LGDSKVVIHPIASLVREAGQVDSAKVKCLSSTPSKYIVHRCCPHVAYDVSIHAPTENCSSFPPLHSPSDKLPDYKARSRNYESASVLYRRSQNNSWATNTLVTMCRGQNMPTAATQILCLQPTLHATTQTVTTIEQQPS
jgi:hypothetical protein